MITATTDDPTRNLRAEFEQAWKAKKTEPKKYGWVDPNYKPLELNISKLAEIFPEKPLKTADNPLDCSP